MEAPELLPLLEARLGASLGAKRAGHSREVAELTARLCLDRGIEPVLGRIAGLAHDLCKELERPVLEELFELFWSKAPLLGIPRPAVAGTFRSAEIIHGPAAAGLLLKDFGYAEASVLEAVAWHTVGSPDMGLLAVLLYCADKLEPSRKHVDGAFREACLAMEPRDMLLAVVDNSISWLRLKGRAIAPETLILYNALRKPV